MSNLSHFWDLSEKSLSDFSKKYIKKGIGRTLYEGQAYCMVWQINETNIMISYKRELHLDMTYSCPQGWMEQNAELFCVLVVLSK